MTEDTESGPVLPVPADLYDEMSDLKDDLDAVRFRLHYFEKQYNLLAANLDSVAVDDLGAPTSAADETQDVLAALINAGWDLDPVGRWLERAHAHASRLRLTDRAAARHGSRFSR